LDPAATGVLPICLGQATRVAEFLADANKLYKAEIELGITTTTYDADGEVVERADPSDITVSHIEECLASFRGAVQQIPPMYSAVRVGGRHLYELARAGLEVARKTRQVHIYRLEAQRISPPFISLEIECSRGTYIRSLAYDLGRKLGCGAYLKSLFRLQSGPFRLSQAVSENQLTDAFNQGTWQELLHPMDSALVSITPAILEDEKLELLVRNGGDVSIPGDAQLADQQPYPANLREYRTLAVPPQHERYRRLYSRDARLIALLRADPLRGVWHPFKVFS